MTDHAFRDSATTKAATGCRRQRWQIAVLAAGASGSIGTGLALSFAAERDAAVRNPERRRRAAQVFLNRHSAPPRSPPARSRRRRPGMPRTRGITDATPAGRGVPPSRGRRNAAPSRRATPSTMWTSARPSQTARRPTFLTGDNGGTRGASGRAVASGRRRYSRRCGSTTSTTPVPLEGTGLAPSSWSA